MLIKHKGALLRELLTDKLKVKIGLKPKPSVVLTRIQMSCEVSCNISKLKLNSDISIFPLLTVSLLLLLFSFTQ